MSGETITLPPLATTLDAYSQFGPIEITPERAEVIEKSRPMGRVPLPNGTRTDKATCAVCGEQSTGKNMGAHIRRKHPAVWAEMQRGIPKGKTLLPAGWYATPNVTLAAMRRLDRDGAAKVEPERPVAPRKRKGPGLDDLFGGLMEVVYPAKAIPIDHLDHALALRDALRTFLEATCPP